MMLDIKVADDIQSTVGVKAILKCHLIFCNPIISIATSKLLNFSKIENSRIFDENVFKESHKNMTKSPNFL